MLPVVADVADRAAVQAGVAAVADRFGRIDILVNNAGISAVGTVEDNDDTEWARVLDVNVLGMVRTTRAALHALTLALAADLVADRIRVNCVCPGTVDTQWVARLLARTADPEQARQRLRDRQPIGRLVTADEVAAAVCYLAGPEAGATTGAALAVDGGMHGLRLPPR